MNPGQDGIKGLSIQEDSGGEGSPASATAGTASSSIPALGARLEGIDLALTIKEECLNDSLSFLHSAGKLPQTWKSDTTTAGGQSTLDVNALNPPTVRIHPGWTPEKGARVDFSLHLGRGHFSYMDDDQRVEFPINNWVITFSTNLATSDLAERIKKAGGVVPPELAAQLESLGEKYLDYRCLYLDLENVNLIDEDSLVVIGPPKLMQVGQRALREHVRRWIEERKTNLDSTLITVMPSQPKPGLEPTVHPTGITFSTGEKKLQGETEPMRYLAMLMTTQGRPVPTHETPKVFERVLPTGDNVDGVLILDAEAALTTTVERLNLAAWVTAWDVQLVNAGEANTFTRLPALKGASSEAFNLIAASYSLTLRPDRRSFDLRWTSAKTLMESTPMPNGGLYTLKCQVRADYRGTLSFQTPPQSAKHWRAVAESIDFRVSGTNWNGEPFDPLHIDEKSWFEMLYSLQRLPKLQEQIAQTRAKIEGDARAFVETEKQLSETIFEGFDFVPPGNANFNFSNLRFDDQLNLLVDVMFDYTYEGRGREGGDDAR